MSYSHYLADDQKLMKSKLESYNQIFAPKLNLLKNHSKEFLIDLVEKSRISSWTAQAYIEPKRLPLLVGVNEEPKEHQLVLGLYCIGNSFPGLLIRPHETKDVINIAQGASSGWGLPVSDQDFDTLLKALPETP